MTETRHHYDVTIDVNNDTLRFAEELASVLGDPDNAVVRPANVQRVQAAARAVRQAASVDMIPPRVEPAEAGVRLVTDGADGDSGPGIRAFVDELFAYETPEEERKAHITVHRTVIEDGEEMHSSSTYTSHQKPAKREAQAGDATKKLHARVLAAVPAAMLHEDDQDVAGRYEITIAGDTPDEEMATAALDGFHRSVAIKELDNFSITVVGPHGLPIDEPEDAEPYGPDRCISVERVAGPDDTPTP